MENLKDNLIIDILLALIIQKKWVLNHWLLTLMLAWQYAKTDCPIISIKGFTDGLPGTLQ